MVRKKEYNPLTAGVSYTIGNMLIKGIPFLTLPLFTRLLSKTDFGLYNTYLAYENIASILLGFGLAGTIRVAKIEYKEKFEQYISAIYGIQILLSTLIDVILYSVFMVLSIESWMTDEVMLMLLINCLCTQIYNIGSAKYAINGEVGKNLAISFVMTILNVGCSLFLCLSVYKEATYIGRIMGTCFAAIIVSIIILMQQVSKCSDWHNKTYWKFGLRMGAPLILHSLSLTLLAQCDKIMIQGLVGNAEAGIYSLSVTISGIIAVIVNAVDNAWAPWFYSNMEKKNTGIIYKYNNYMIILFTAFSVMFILISPDIIHLMSAKEYWDSIYTTPLLLISVLFNFYYLIPVNFEYYHKKTGYIAYSTVITAIINVILNYVLLIVIGYYGAALATCASKIILFVMHWRKAKQLENIKLLSIGVVFLCAVVSAIVSMITIIDANGWIIRYAMLIPMGCLGLFVCKKHNVSRTLCGRFKG